METFRFSRFHPNFHSQSRRPRKRKFQSGAVSPDLNQRGQDADMSYGKLLLVWSPGAESVIHDHADSHCIMKVHDRSLIRETSKLSAQLTAGLDADPQRKSSGDALRMAFYHRT